MPDNDKLFDPVGMKPEEYRGRYPELKRIKEFDILSVSALIFVWWYANPTSDLISVTNDFERVKLALEQSKYKPSKALRENILQLRFSDDLAMAIDRMSRLRDDVRIRAKIMLASIFKNYETIVTNLGTITPNDDDAEKTKYITMTINITKELPMLVLKMEEGFGVSTRSDDEEEALINIPVRDYFRSKEQ